MIHLLKKIKDSYQYNFDSLLIKDVKNSKNPYQNLDSLSETLWKEFYKYNNSKNNLYAQPIIAFIQSFHFHIFRANFHDMKNKSSKLDKVNAILAVDGELYKEYKTDKIIIINENEPLESQRFMIAHQFAHYVFDFNEQTQINYYNYYRQEDAYDNEKELRASYFAHALLLPKKIFIDRFQQLQNLTYYEKINQLSNDFQVCPYTVKYRINALIEMGDLNGK